MNSLQNDLLSKLPLSWARTDTTEPVFNQVRLPYSKPAWIPTAEIPHQYSFNWVFQEYLSTLPHGFVLQSCSRHVRDNLIEKGCQAAAMGAEAVLDLPWRGRRSVRELSRRGRRHGTVRQIEPDRGHQIKLAELANNSPARQGVQLKFTERSKFDGGTRCFIFESYEQKWLGAITLSTPGPFFAHIEFLLRHRNAPVGVMEALISTIAEKLASEGFQQLSLGAVTPVPAEAFERIFKPHRHPEELWIRSRLAFRLGRALRFAYNAEGLWHFKNKFSPRWEPLYLCASPTLSWATIVGMVQATGYFDLVQERIKSAWSNLISKVKFPIPAIGRTSYCGKMGAVNPKLPLQMPNRICAAIPKEQINSTTMPSPPS